MACSTAQYDHLVYARAVKEDNDWKRRWRRSHKSASRRIRDSVEHYRQVDFEDADIRLTETVIKILVSEGLVTKLERPRVI